MRISLHVNDTKKSRISNFVWLIFILSNYDNIFFKLYPIAYLKIIWFIIKQFFIFFITSSVIKTTKFYWFFKASLFFKIRYLNTFLPARECQIESSAEFLFRASLNNQYVIMWIKNIENLWLGRFHSFATLRNKIRRYWKVKFWDTLIDWYLKKQKNEYKLSVWLNDYLI